MVSRARSHTARRGADRRGLVGVVLLALALIAAGCGSDEPEAQPLSGQEELADGRVDISEAAPVGEVLAGSVSALAECRDWNGANDAEKLATIEDIRSAEYTEDPGIEGPVMTDEEALELFDGACEPTHAQGFRLYKLYSHAAGFLPLKRVLDDE